MLQDIQNFSDITAIDTKDKLQVILEYKIHNSNDYIFSVNGISCDNSRTELLFDLLEPLEFKCKINNGAIEIVKLTINNYEIMPLYLHLANPKTSWIIESWYLHIPQSFYPWYHQLTGQGWIA